MKLPVVRGVIDRRLLVNYRADPDVLASLLPPPFRPKVIHGYGIVGICLIRLKHVRPRGVPGFLGINSENRIARPSNGTAPAACARGSTSGDGTPTRASTH